MRSLLGTSPRARSLDYDGDDLGRIIEVIETRGSTTTTTEYVYNADGRLEEVLEDSVSVMSMGYDDNGNRTSITTSSGTTSCTYDAQDRLVSCGDIDYGFDDDGDLISRTDTVANETTDCGCDSRGRWTR